MAKKTETPIYDAKLIKTQKQARQFLALDVAKPETVAHNARAVAKVRREYGALKAWAKSVAILASENRKEAEALIREVLAQPELTGAGEANSARTNIRQALDRELGYRGMKLKPRGKGAIMAKPKKEKPAPANPDNDSTLGDSAPSPSGKVEPTSRDKPIESAAPTDQAHGAADTLIALRDRVMVAVSDYQTAAGYDAAIDLLAELMAAMETHKAQDAASANKTDKGASRKGKRA